MKNIKVYHYAGENNFGDIFGIEMLRKMFPDYNFVHENNKDSLDLKLCLTGSILNNDINNSIHIGTGIAWANDSIGLGCTPIITRGVISMAKANDVNVKCIDPVLFSKDVFPAKKYEQQNKTELCILPHYTGYNFCIENYGDSGIVDGISYRVVDICSGVESVISEVVNSNCIATSSLHGMALAISYNKPFCFVNSDLILGDGTKHEDLFSIINNSFLTADSFDIKGCRDLAVSSPTCEIIKRSYIPTFEEFKDICFGFVKSYPKQ